MTSTVNMTKKLNLYTTLAKLYDEIYPKIFSYKRDAGLVNKICKKFKLKKILEVGCGTGHLAKLIKESGYDIIGTDLYTEMLTLARKNAPNVKFLKQDMRDLKLKQRFDAVICFGKSFTYMTTNEEVEKALNSFNKVLKKGGVLIFDNYNCKEMVKNFEKKYRQMTQKIKLGDKLVIRKHTQTWNLKTGITWNWNCNYIIKKGNTIIKKFKDSSVLRAFFKEELGYFLKSAGFKIVTFYPRKFIIVAKKV